jgi:hypothetical protein
MQQRQANERNEKKGKVECEKPQPDQTKIKKVDCFVRPRYSSFSVYATVLWLFTPRFHPTVVRQAGKREQSVQFKHSYWICLADLQDIINIQQ